MNDFDIREVTYKEMFLTLVSAYSYSRCIDHCLYYVPRLLEDPPIDPGCDLNIKYTPLNLIRIAKYCANQLSKVTMTDKYNEKIAETCRKAVFATYHKEHTFLTAQARMKLFRELQKTHKKTNLTPPIVHCSGVFGKSADFVILDEFVNAKPGDCVRMYNMKVPERDPIKKPKLLKRFLSQLKRLAPP